MRFDRRGKYGNRKVEVKGYTFDSKAEAQRFTLLEILQMAGEIHSLEVHPVYLLQDAFKSGGKTIRPITYEGDFSYVEKGKDIVEDVKGIETEVFRIKRKMFLAKYPCIELRIVRNRRKK